MKLQLAVSFKQRNSQRYLNIIMIGQLRLGGTREKIICERTQQVENGNKKSPARAVGN